MRRAPRPIGYNGLEGTSATEMVNDRITALRPDIRSGLRKLYGDRLRGVYLYGSYARGEDDGESDVDVLIVLDRLDSYAGEIARTSELVSGLSLKHGLSVSRVFVSEHDWAGRSTPFLVHARAEAIPA